MANHKSSEKRIKITAAKTKVNDARRSRIRTLIKKVEALLVKGSADEAAVAFKAAESEMNKGVNKGVMHKNTAARKASRLNKRIKAAAGK